MLKEGYKKSEIGVIPEDWEVKSIGNCSDVTKLAGFEFTEYINYIDDGEIIALRALNLKNGKLELSDVKRIDKVVSEGLQRSKLHLGDMLFSYVGTVGEVALIEEDDKYHLAPNVAKITFRDIVKPEYAIQYFMGEVIKDEVRKYVTTTSQPALSMENIRKMKIIVPPLKEQEKIAEILSTVDCQIDDTKMLIEKCRVLKKGLMQRLLSRGIGHCEFKNSEVGEIPVTVDCQIDDTKMLIEKCRVLKKGLMQRLLSRGIGHCEFKNSEVGEIPVGWEVLGFFDFVERIIDFRGRTPKKLGLDWGGIGHCEFKNSEVGEIPVGWEVLGFFDFVERIIDFRGRTPKKLGLDWGGGDILALSANNVKMGNIDFTIENYFASNELYEKWMLGSELCKNDILMTMEAPLGNVALVPDNKKYILSQRVVALKTKEFINNEFMLYMIMSDIIQNQLNMLSTGTTAKGINQKNLAKVKVVIPTLEEQEKIAQILSSVDNQIEEYENKKQQLEELKKGLMQQLLIGKIRTV